MIRIDGRDVEERAGETVLELAQREGIAIPTLCHDPRLEPAGACRTCLVEIDGWRRLAPACATRVAPGMTIQTHNERVQRHQRALLSLYMTDHAEHAGGIPQVRDELVDMAEAVGAELDWPRMAPERAARPGDRNPYIEFRPDLCILCARCTRYCAEVESVSAITLAGRGAHTTIFTADGQSLLDSSCELCGGCIDTCPTGAMTEKIPLTLAAKPDRELEKVRSTCNYCGVGCQLELNVDRDGNDGRGRVVKVTSPPPGTPPNDGNLCVKGRFAYEFIDHPDRLTAPLVRGDDGQLHEATWDEALARAAAGLRGVADRHGGDALGFVSSSRCTMEENFLVQKLSRAVFGTNNVHQCAAT